MHNHAQFHKTLNLICDAEKGTEAIGNMEHDQQQIKVLHLIEHLRVGGAERLVSDLVKNLNGARIHSIVCLYRQLGSIGSELINSGYHVVLLRKDILTSGLPRQMIFLKPVFLVIESIIFVFRLAKMMREERIDVLHSHMFSANLWGRLASLIGGRPAVITTEHSINGSLGTFKERIINRLLSPISDRIVAVSQQVADAVVNKQNLPKERIIIIRNGLQLRSTTTLKEKERIRIPNDLAGQGPIVISIGRLVKQKRHDILIKSMKYCSERLPAVSCWIIGDGPERDNLQQLVHKLNLKKVVYFLGERIDARGLLQYADVYANTSDEEGLPITLLEAMDAGLPIVATNAGGNKEIIRTGENGILVDRGNAAMICDAISNILERPEISEKMGRQGKTLVRDLYDIQKVAILWENLYEEVLQENVKAVLRRRLQ